MRIEAYLIVLPALLLAAPAAEAQTGRNAAERTRDHVELHQDRQATRDDAGDLAQLERLQGQYEAACAAGDSKEIGRLDRVILAKLKGEIGESKNEEARAKAELRGDRREVRSDRREIRDNRKSAAGAWQRADDRKDLRDDRRDRRDDRQDLKAEQHELRTKRDLAADFTPLVGKTDGASLQAKQRIVDEMLGLARDEIGKNAAERSEDRRELREDRRETREDRRQRN